MIYGYIREFEGATQFYGLDVGERLRVLRANGAQEVFADDWPGNAIDSPKFQTVCDKLKPGDVVMLVGDRQLAMTFEKSIHELLAVRAKGARLYSLGIHRRTEEQSHYGLKEIIKIGFFPFTINFIIQAIVWAVLCQKVFAK